MYTSWFGCELEPQALKWICVKMGMA